MKIQTKMYNLGSWGCLLFCYLKMINKDPFTAYTDFTLDKSNCVEQGKITDYHIIKS